MTEQQAVKKPTNIEEAVANHNTWQVKPEISVKVADLLDPNYWAHVARRMRAGDIVIAVPDDRHYFAELFVLAASTNWVKMVVLRHKVLIKDNEATEKNGYIVKFAGAHKWRVEKDGEVLSKNHDDQKSAAEWLTNHIKDTT